MYLGAVECFDPTKRKWFRVADIGIQRSFVSVAVCNGHLYAVGGEDRSCSYNVVERYDTARNKWVPVRGMKRKRSGAGVAVNDGKFESFPCPLSLPFLKAPLHGVLVGEWSHGTLCTDVNQKKCISFEKMVCSVTSCLA